MNDIMLNDIVNIVGNKGKSSYVYKNGNYIVRYNHFLRKLTKRALRLNEELVSDFPDSIDLKISNRCNIGCPFCHENSIKNGKIYNFDNTTKILSQLPKLPIEIAIGGGDILENPQETLRLVNWLKQNNFKPRLTINYKSINEKSFDDFKALSNTVDCIGLSINDFDSNDVKLKKILRENNIIIHIIAGIFPYNKLNELLEVVRDPILVLGYKQFGRASNTELPSSLSNFEEVIKRTIIKYRSENYYRILSFDNLALEQLNIKDSISEKNWDNLFMGYEGKHSMYIDAVEEKFAKTSREPEENRVSWNDIKLLDFFNKIKS